MDRVRSIAGLFVSGLVQLAGVLTVAGSGAGWSLTNPFHYCHDPLLLRLNAPEMVLVLGLLMYVAATPVLVALLEARAVAAGRRSRFAALGLLPAVGVAAYFFSSPTHARNEPTAEPDACGQKAPAAVCIALAGLTLIGGIIFIAATGDPFADKPRITPDTANREAYAAIKAIAAAQSAYFENDWDGDGEHEYALFLPHLWRTPRRDGPPVDVGLIPEELARSRVRDFAYYDSLFHNLHHQEIAGGVGAKPASGRSRKPPLRDIDYTQGWAVAVEAIGTWHPEDEHNALQFVALSDGSVFARKDKGLELTFVPRDLNKAWSPVSSLADIERLQRKPPKDKGNAKKQ